MKIDIHIKKINIFEKEERKDEIGGGCFFFFDIFNEWSIDYYSTCCIEE